MSLATTDVTRYDEMNIERLDLIIPTSEIISLMDRNFLRTLRTFANVREKVRANRYEVAEYSMPRWRFNYNTALTITVRRRERYKNKNRAKNLVNGGRRNEVVASSHVASEKRGKSEGGIAGWGTGDNEREDEDEDANEDEDEGDDDVDEIRQVVGGRASRRKAASFVEQGVSWAG
jgi:hypothetical protein